MKKRYKPKQKAQIVLEILKEERTVTQISSEYGIHTSQLYKWKNQALEGLPNLFEEDLKTELSTTITNGHALHHGDN